MSSIFDFEDKSSVDPVFPVPAEAQFPDDEDMEPGTKLKYAIRGDMLVRNFRGTANAGSSGRHVINLGVSVQNNDDYDGSGEQTWWFDEEGFEGQWGHISKSQVASLAKLAVAMGLVEKESFNDLSPLDAVELIIESTKKFNRDLGYTFGGMLQFVKTCKDDGRVFLNTNLYINNCPKVEAPF